MADPDLHVAEKTKADCNHIYDLANRKAFKKNAFNLI